MHIIGTDAVQDILPYRGDVPEQDRHTKQMSVHDQAHSPRVWFNGDDNHFSAYPKSWLRAPERDFSITGGSIDMDTLFRVLKSSDISDTSWYDALLSQKQSPSSLKKQLTEKLTAIERDIDSIQNITSLTDILKASLIAPLATEKVLIQTML